jgi:hypothetical protein
VDAVEVDDDAVIHLADLEAVAAAEHIMLVEIHTVGDWMIRLKLETIVLETVQEKLHRKDSTGGGVIAVHSLVNWTLSRVEAGRLLAVVHPYKVQGGGWSIEDSASLSYGW